MEFEGRKILFKSLVGSHNYNLQTATSDKDYKIFVLPTFDDLYEGKHFSKSIVGEAEDWDVHDIRKATHLWWKSNINFLEVLFSEECIVNVNLKLTTLSKLDIIFKYKDDIARMNLPYLYDACIGMYRTKRNNIHKGTEGTQHLIDKFGFNTKEAMHSLRVLDFIARFANSGFTNFKSAIWFNSDTVSKYILESVRYGGYSEEMYLKLADEIFNTVQNRHETIYKSQLPDEELKNKILVLIKEIIQNEMR